MNRLSRMQALLLFLVATAGLFVSSFLDVLLPREGGPATLLLSNLIYYLPFAVLPAALCLRGRKGSLMSIRPGPISLWNVLLIASMALLCVFFVNDLTLLWSMLLQTLGLNVGGSDLPIPGDTAGLAVCVLSVAVLPGVCEELLFRGAMFSGFENGGTKRAGWITSILFMLIHGSVIGAPGQLLLGLLMAELVLCCDSIYASAIFHTVYNAALVLIQFLQDRELPAQEPIADYFTALGGWGGVGSLLLSVVLTGLLLRFMLRVFRLRAKVIQIETLPEKRQRLSAPEVLAVIGCGALCLGLFAFDIAAMLTGG